MFCATAAADCPLLLLAGFLPNFTRLGSWNVAMFLILEQVKIVVTPKEK